MKKQYFKSLLALLTIGVVYGLTSCSGNDSENAPAPIIPAPNEMTMEKGVYALSSKTSIVYTDVSFEETAKYLQQKLQEETGTNVNISLKEQAAKGAICLVKTDGMADEAYTLQVEKNRILCNATQPAGVFYAVQSLLQAIKQENGKHVLPCMKVTDAPRFAWRGFMLDEARHFFGMETVKQYLDVMAKLKLNRFHWHLTDEPGWRIEIKKYPLLTEIGGKGSWSDRNTEARFYTQNQIKEIVEYARQRQIMVIPEIDMPGHASAACRAYPYLSGGGEGKWAGFTFHPTKETTYQFVSDVLDEVTQLFPAPYIHIGGDEVHFGNQSWYTDREIQQFIRKNNLKDPVGLEHYFINRVKDMVVQRGRKLLGWDEILGAGVENNTTSIMWWRHDKPGELTKGIDGGYEMIMCPRIPCYLDFVQDDSHKIGRRWGGKFGDIATTYNFTESIQSRIEGKEDQIMGVQANMWTERIRDKKRLDFMVFPRLLGIAENGWTQIPNKDYDSFLERTKVFMQYLDKLNIYYFNIFDKESTPEPWGPDKEDPIANG